MDQVPLSKAPPPHHGGVGPWVEVSAWILAFAILLAAQCVPERSTSEAAPTSTSSASTP